MPSTLPDPEPVAAFPPDFQGVPYVAADSDAVALPKKWYQEELGKPAWIALSLPVLIILYLLVEQTTTLLLILSGIGVLGAIGAGILTLLRGKTTTTRNTGIVGLALAGVSLAFLAFFALQFASGSLNTTIDGTKLEDEISTALGKMGYEGLSVSCPSGQPAKVGDGFDCAVTDPATGDTATVKVSVQDRDGRVSWQILSPSSASESVGEAPLPQESEDTGAADLNTTAANQQSVAELEKDMMKDAQTLHKDGTYDEKVTSVECTAVSENSVNSLGETTSEFSCLGVYAEDANGFQRGYRGTAVVNWTTGAYTWQWG